MSDEEVQEHDEISEAFFDLRIGPSLRDHDWTEEQILQARQGFLRDVLGAREELRGYVTKTGRELSDSDIEALSAEAEAGYPVYRWDCTVNFTVRSGELDLDAERALYGHKVRRTPEPGTFRYMSYVPSLNSIAAQLVAQSELAVLLRPFEDVDYFVHFSSATCIGEVKE